MKIIYVNCSWTKAIWKWPSQLYEHYLSNSENKAWKNSGLYGTSDTSVSQLNEYQINPVKWLVNDCKYMKIIYVNCSWTKAIWKWPSQLYEHYLSNSENKAWKNSGLYGTSGINFHYCITARITSIFVSSTIVYMIIFIYL